MFAIFLLNLQFFDQKLGMILDFFTLKFEIFLLSLQIFNLKLGMIRDRLNLNL